MSGTEENEAALDDDSSPSRRGRRLLWLPALSLGVLLASWGGFEGLVCAGAEICTATGSMVSWMDFLPVHVLTAVGVLIALSAFFSGSEAAFFSIHRLQLRSMRGEKATTGRLVAQVMEHPARVLTTILMGNIIVNILVSVLLGTRVEDLFGHRFQLPTALAYASAVIVCTAVLVLFGEIAPKVLAVRTRKIFAQAAVVPLLATDKVLSPLRDGLLRFTDFLFHVTRFHALHAAPFITDDELKSVLSNGAAQGVIEQEERQMIQGVLEFSNALLREILVPRPDVIALPETATVADALACLREHEFSRMPVYEDDLDHISGILVMKDVLPDFAAGELDRPIKALARPAHFVPETMTVRDFVKEAQRHRYHLAMVVDEYGGTAGIVTLEDAIEEVVGEIMDEHEKSALPYEQIGEGEYRVQGSFPLDELSDLIGVSFVDKEHETVAGFLMNHIERIPETGDHLEHSGVGFTVEACEGKRASSVRVRVLAQPHHTADEGERR